MKHVCMCFLLLLILMTITVSLNLRESAGYYEKMPDSADEVPDTTGKVPDSADKVPDTTDKAPDNVQEIYKYVLEKASLFITTDTAVEILGVKYRRARAVLLSMVEKRRCFTKYDLRKNTEER